MKNIINGTEYDIFDNEPSPSIRGVRFQVTSVLRTTGTVQVTRYDYTTGEYTTESYTEDDYNTFLGDRPVPSAVNKLFNKADLSEESKKIQLPRVDGNPLPMIPNNVETYGNLWVYKIHLKENGEAKDRHAHEFDHLHLIVKGSARFEVFDKDNNTVYSKEFTAPEWIKIPKMHDHQITALEADTIGYCIHPMRNENDDIIDSDLLSEVLEDYSFTPSESLCEIMKES